MRLPYLDAGRAVVVLALAGAVIAALLLVSGETAERRIVVDADQARFLTKGADVRMAGKVVGEVAEAEPTREGRARLELQIDDDAAWPVPSGTTARFTWGSTIAYTNRRVDLVVPRGGGEPLAEGATIPADDVTTSVEVDDVLGAFDGESRKDLQRFFDEGGEAVGAAKQPLRRAVKAAPPALEEVSAALDELGGDEAALGTLVRQTDAVVHAVQRSNPGIGRLLTGAAGTLEAIGGRAVELQQTLSRLPQALDRTRTTLAHADSTLLSANDLATRLRPGVAELRRITAPLNRTLATVEDVGPDARRTLASLRKAAPDLTPLLTTATEQMPRIQKIGHEAAKAVGCIRPFSPEIAGFLTTWQGMNTLGDDKDKFFRGNFIAYPFGLTTTDNSAEIEQKFPALDYAFPRPPGQSSGQPWFQPQCNLGPETLDPSKDPEAR